MALIVSQGGVVLTAILVSVLKTVREMVFA